MLTPTASPKTKVGIEARARCAEEELRIVVGQARRDGVGRLAASAFARLVTHAVHAVTGVLQRHRHEEVMQADVRLLRATKDTRVGRWARGIFGRHVRRRHRGDGAIIERLLLFDARLAHGERHHRHRHQIVWIARRVGCERERLRQARRPVNDRVRLAEALIARRRCRDAHALDVVGYDDLRRDADGELRRDSVAAAGKAHEGNEHCRG